MNYNLNTEEIRNEFEQGMPFAVFKTRVRPYGDWEYRENGVNFLVIFEAVHGDVPLCSIMDGDSEPITGESVQYIVREIREYGVNRLWEVIPYEFLHADIERNQVKVVKDGVDSICPDFNCGYAYVDDEDDYAITSQNLNGLTLTLTGAELPVFGSECNNRRRRLYTNQDSGPKMGFEQFEEENKD